MNKLNQILDQVKLTELIAAYAALFFMYRMVPAQADYLHGLISVLLLTTIALIAIRGWLKLVR